MKTILIDGTTLSRMTDGLTQYTMSVIVELIKSSEKKYILIHRTGEIPSIYKKELARYSDKIILEEVDIPPIGPLRDYKFSKWYKKNKERFSYFYEPSAQYPLGIDGGIYTVHDILYEEYPEKLGRYSFLKKIYLHFVVARGLKKCDVVITVSNYTKSEILKYHRKKEIEKKIVVIYEGYEHLYHISLCESDSVVQNILSFNEKFFMYIGSSRGHKNLHNLFLAYEKSMIDWKLIVVGRMDRLEPSDKLLVEAINKVNTKIIFTGWLSEDQMYTILSKASGFVFPSKSEGFGIPILESYFFKVPLLCSDIPVFKEVASDACVMFNPNDINDISNVLQKFVARSEEDNNILIKKQSERLKKFSWKYIANSINNFF